MVPVVRRHEELTAVLRVVIAVRACGERPFPPRAVGAGAGLEGAFRLADARPPFRHRDLNQLPAVDRTGSRLVLRDRRMDWAGPDRSQTDSLQAHPALWTVPRLVLDDVGVLGHRAYVRERRQRFLCAGRACTGWTKQEEDNGERTPHRANLPPYLI